MFIGGELILVDHIPLDLFERKQRKYALMTILAAPTKLCPLVPIATLWSSVCLLDIVQLLYHADHLHDFHQNMQEFFNHSSTILVPFFVIATLRRERPS